MNIREQDEAEALLCEYIVRQCPELGHKINQIRNNTNMRKCKCAYCGDEIIWSSSNQYSQPLNIDLTLHCCLIQNTASPWDEGECPYCGELDCECAS